jgi:hypothetical protein
VKVRAALGLSTLAVVALLVLELSGTATRTAGSDHAAPMLFSLPVAGGKSACQQVAGLPGDAARVELTVGTQGRPVPALTLRFLDAGGATVAEGALARGAHEGVLLIPVRHVAGPEPVLACIHVGPAKGSVFIGAEGVPIDASSATIGGVHVGNRLSLIYLRAGSESWWQLLPTLSERFGLGKAGFLGDWFLALAALGLVGVWAATLRLLLRELR